MIRAWRVVRPGPLYLLGTHRLARDGAERWSWCSEEAGGVLVPPRQIAHVLEILREIGVTDAAQVLPIHEPPHVMGLLPGIASDPPSAVQIPLFGGP